MRRNENPTPSGRPQIFIKKLVFNDGTQLLLDHASIVVFTGANNCGKSQALKDIEFLLDEVNQINSIVVKEAEYDFCGTITDNSFISENFFTNDIGYLQPRGFSGTANTLDSLEMYWRKHTLYNNLHLLFVKRLSTEQRLLASNALIRANQPEKHSIYKLFKSESLAQRLSDYFLQAFGVALVVNRNEMQTVPLHVGLEPDKSAFSILKQDDYYRLVSMLPLLQNQGDGMRSFASILLDTFTSEYSITLIDEPEAFLHPPQARVLGKMLAKNNPIDRQLLISTHSEDFLQGLLDANCENVVVIRIERVNTVNRMSVLHNEEIKTLWGNPLLRYSNILSGLFHEKVVVCESDYDCLFYQAVMDAMYENKNEIAPDILFTHCGGKARVKDVVKALKAVSVPVVAICDFDLLDSRQVFRSIIESLGLNWNSLLSAGMEKIYDSMNGKFRPGYNAWKEIKTIGKHGFSGDEPAAYDRVEELCKAAGLFIVPVGEMECFDKSISKQKKDWIFEVLERYNLATEEKLKEARRFVQAIVEFSC